MANLVDTSSSLTLAEVEERLGWCIEAQLPAFLWAGPGIGKSSLIYSIAKQKGGHCIDVRLSQMDPSDIRGIPFYNKDTGTMCWAPPEILPSAEFCAEFPLVILFLDEMNSAPPSVQAASYQLVLNRRVGSYVLPNNVAIIAAGNREGDKGVTYRQPAPLSNRFLHFDVRHDYDSWLQWALSAQVHADVISFLTVNKGYLYMFDANSADKSFPTPRSWEMVSKLLWLGNDKNPMSEKTRRDLVASASGSGTATSFRAFLLKGKNLPKASDILSGKVTKLETKEISAQYQVILNIMYELKDFWYANSRPTGNLVPVKNGKFEEREWNAPNRKDEKEWQGQLDYFMTFVLNNLDYEIAIMAMRFGFHMNHFPKGTDMTQLKNWSKITEKYIKFLQ